MGQRLVPIREAAEALGVSEDTVRRRIKSGDLTATREQIAGGFRYLVELDARTHPEPAVHEAGDTTDSSVTVEVLRDQVTHLQTQVNRLTELLAREQQVVQSLLAPRALPAQSETVPTPADPPVPTRSEPVQHTPHGWLARLRKRLS